MAVRARAVDPGSARMRMPGAQVTRSRPECRIGGFGHGQRTVYVGDDLDSPRTVPADLTECVINPQRARCAQAVAPNCVLEQGAVPTTWLPPSLLTQPGPKFKNSGRSASPLRPTHATHRINVPLDGTNRVRLAVLDDPMCELDRIFLRRGGLWSHIFDRQARDAATTLEDLLVTLHAAQ